MIGIASDKQRILWGPMCRFSDSKQSEMSPSRLLKGAYREIKCFQRVSVGFLTPKAYITFSAILSNVSQGGDDLYYRRHGCKYLDENIYSNRNLCLPLVFIFEEKYMFQLYHLYFWVYKISQTERKSFLERSGHQ